MKGILITCITLFSINVCWGQFDFGITAGISTMDVKSEQLTYLINDRERFEIETMEARYGIQLGAFAIAQFNRFYLMPEVLLHSRKFEHHLQDFGSSGEVFDVVRTEKLNSVDVGLMMGYKLYFLRLGAGPVCQMYIDNVSQLWAERGYDEAFQTAQWGAQAGAGIDILMVHLDLRYQFNFTKFGDHITFFGEKAELSQHPGIWSVRVGWSF